MIGRQRQEQVDLKVASALQNVQQLKPPSAVRRRRAGIAMLGAAGLFVLWVVGRVLKQSF